MLSSISSGMMNCIPSPEGVARSFAKNHRAMAITAVAITALSSIPSVDGGPLTYALCVAGCSFASTIAAPFCLAACAIGLGLPGAP